jgi:hypothetical protein
MGNLMNKQWSQQANISSDDEKCENATTVETGNDDNAQDKKAEGNNNNEASIIETKSQIYKRKLSSLLSSNSGSNLARGDYMRVNGGGNDQTPAGNSKIILSKFDPRSPSNEIVR